MSYHVATSKCENAQNEVCMPLQWSAAYEGLSGLIGIVTLNILYCISSELINRINDTVPHDFVTDPDPHAAAKGQLSCPTNKISNDWKELIKTIDMYRNVVRALQMDNEWKLTTTSKVISSIMTILSPTSISLFTKPLKSHFATDAGNDVNQIQKLCELRNNLQDVINANKCTLDYTSYGGLEDIWIVKPVGLSCGEKIVCVRNLDGVLSAAKNLEYKCVVQKYIERPLLVRGDRKFDIRQWVLVTSTDPLVLYGFSECYLRLSGEPFSLSTGDLDRPSVHLCNHAIQKHNHKIDSTNTKTDVDAVPIESPESNSLTYIDERRGSVGLGENTSVSVPHLYDTMMSQREFESELVARSVSPTIHADNSPVNRPVSASRNIHIFKEKILPLIKRASVNVLLSVRDKLVREGKGFEWLGLDLMVVEREGEYSSSCSSNSSGISGPTIDREKKRGVEYEVLLLEVNVSPDISLSTPVTAQLISPAVRDLFDLLLDEGALSDPLAAAAADCDRNKSIVGSRTGPTIDSSYSGSGSSSVSDIGSSSNSSSDRRRSSISCACGGSSSSGINGSSVVAEKENEQSELSPSTECECERETQPSLRWDLWHVGRPQGKRSSLAFTRAKQDACFLGSRVDYLPRNVGTADRVIEILKSCTSTSANASASASACTSMGTGMRGDRYVGSDLCGEGSRTSSASSYTVQDREEGKEEEEEEL